MSLLVNTHNKLSLEDHNNFKGFSRVDNSMDSNRSALQNIASATEHNHYWIKIQSVIDLSPQANDSVWIESFWKMIKSAEPYGYVDMENHLLKAHIEEAK